MGPDDDTGTPRMRVVKVDSPRRATLPQGAVPAGGPVAEAQMLESGPDPVIAPKGGTYRRKLCLILSGLLVLAAVAGGVAYFVFLRDNDSDNPTVATTEDTSPSGAVLANQADRGLNGTSPGTSVTPLAPGTGVTPDTPTGSTPPPGATSPTSPGTPPTTPPTTPTTPSPPLSPPPVAPSPPPPAPPPPPPAPVVYKPLPINPALGEYGPLIEFPVIPVAIAVLPTGKVLAWSAFDEDDFDISAGAKRFSMTGGGKGFTQFAVYDAKTEKVSGIKIDNTDHDMFCPGISMLGNGDIVVTGGQNAIKTSIYRLGKDTWEPAEDMHIARGYGSSTLLSNGLVFVLGGSWSGPKDLAKDAELYDPTTNTWKQLTKIQAAYILTNDPEGVYRADNYGWFFAWTGGTVFHGGPSTTMHWFTTDGDGGALVAGTRPGGNSANGNAVMFDTGKVLTCGGSESFAKPQYPATTEANLITIGKALTQVQVKELSPMNLARVYANGVVLPDGKVFIHGGADTPKEFSDEFAQFEPEMWDPATEEFVLLKAKHVKPRTYHSVAALLPDGRVFTGGGGLCGERCGIVNHLDAEIFTPGQLYTADGVLAPRPTVTLSAKVAANGETLNVTSSEPLMTVAMIRMGSATHSTNTDQRRIELCGPFTQPCGLSPVSFTVHADTGVALPGNWMVFGVNPAGVWSEAAILLVGITNGAS